MNTQVKQAGLDWFGRCGLSKVMVAITLTTDPAKYDFGKRSMSDIDTLMRKELRHLHNKINDRIYGTRNWSRKHKGADIFAVREEKHKQPHIHMALALEDVSQARKISNFIERYWPQTRTGGWSIHMELITDADGWMNYSLKHMSPTDTDAIYACKGVLN